MELLYYYLDVYSGQETINEVMIAIFYGISTIRDLQDLLANPKDNKKRKGQFLLFWTVFALSHLVSLGYWALRLYDINMVVPKEEQHAIAWQSNVTHGLNGVFLYLELLFFEV